MTNMRLEVRDFIAEIRFDRPGKMNAVTPEMADAIAEICREVDRREDVRVVMLAGAGERAFCAGSDLDALAEYPSVWAFRNRTEYSTAFRDIRKPVVAALKGWVLGGGAETALSADIRIADETAKFGFPEVKHGWVGGGGASQMLPRICGYGQAMRLLLTGDVVDAAEARTLGLVEEVVSAGEVETAVRKLCERIAAYSPVATEAVKASVRMGVAAGLESGLRYENEMNTLCFATGDHMKGIEAFRGRRG